jgi:hypothetical protein
LPVPSLSPPAGFVLWAFLGLPVIIVFALAIGVLRLVVWFVAVVVYLVGAIVSSLTHRAL